MLKLSDAPATIPDGRRVYAIGDVHGCDDQLAAMHARIAADCAERPVGEAVLVHLGDYVDRGLDSAGVLRRIGGPPPAGIARMINLCGNHEMMMLDALDDASDQTAEAWLFNGGSATLASFGAADAPRAEWAGAVGAVTRGQLDNLRLRHLEGGYLFVHAGLRPGVPLAEQTAHDMLWMREPFLSSTADHGVVVVHGHTPNAQPVLRRNRIGLDTGAAFGGRLTCAVLEGRRMGLIAV